MPVKLKVEPSKDTRTPEQLRADADAVNPPSWQKFKAKKEKLESLKK